jgi:hypothetical protein
MLPDWLFDFSLKAKGAKDSKLMLLSKHACRRANLWLLVAAELIPTAPVPLTATHLTDNLHPQDIASVSTRPHGFLCTKLCKPLSRNESLSQSELELAG